MGKNREARAIDQRQCVSVPLIPPSSTAYRLTKRLASVVMAAAGLLAAGGAQADFQGSHHIVAYDEEPYGYSKWDAEDPVARLARRLETEEARLDHEDTHGYLQALLKALEIPESSQVLVFSKTSLHRDLISPAAPRALYFNDDVYVGWVRWAPVLEISAVDPHRGGMFYVLPQNESKPTRLVRNHSCVECHVSRFSMGVPGHLIRSVPTDEQGGTGDITGGARVSHDTPYAERRGGWYATGAHGKQQHLANLAGAGDFERHEREPGFRRDTVSLAGFIDTNLYLRPGSDLVALMVLEHQVHMHNFIARLNYEATLRLHQYGHVRYTHKIAYSFLEYLLFAHEARLRAPARGASGFAGDFERRGPRDAQGRSLRAFDLQTRLFKYPCSYLIYSAAFDGLPDPLKDYLYRRLWDILGGRDGSGQFDHLDRSTRRAILEIIRETKPGLPEYWRATRANEDP